MKIENNRMAEEIWDIYLYKLHPTSNHHCTQVNQLTQQQQKRYNYVHPNSGTSQ